VCFAGCVKMSELVFHDGLSRLNVGASSGAPYYSVPGGAPILRVL
jgi:hypothetical protein